MTGFISTKGALPSQFAEIVPSDTAFSDPARSAVPSISATGFFIQAVSGGETINGTVSNNGTYSISLALGRTYTITAELKDGTTTLMSDEWPDVTPTRANAGNLIHDFLLKPVGTANGFVELRITISNSNVKKIKICCSDTNFGGTIEENITGTTYTFSKSKVIDAETGAVSGGMKIGIYEVTFSFYNTSGILLYSSTQSVTVLSGQTTNKWISGGGSAEPINSSGNFEVTSDLISTFARTQIYVGSTKNPDGTILAEGSESGTGSPYAPFNKVQKAIALIESAGTSTSDYNIWISGDVKGCTVIQDTITTSKARTITIQGTSGNTTDTLNGNKNGTVLTVNSAVPVTIKNLKITGGKNTNGDGGGIYMNTGTKVTLGTGALVGDVIETTNMAAASYSTDGSTYGNIAKNGGGIYNNGGTLILENGSYVSHNYAGGTEQDSGEAGGIYVYGGSLEIKEGASIRLNKCYSRGGGLSLHDGCSVTITGGSIEYNEVNLWGGGIFCGTGSGSVRFEMTSGSISHNKSTLSSKDDIGGGGIYLDDKDASFTMSGTALISENYAARKGGGLIIGNDCSLAMTGGTISKNWTDASGTAGSSNLKGGGAAFLYGTIKMSGSASIPFGAFDSNGTLVTGVNKNDVKFNMSADAPPNIVITGSLTATAPVATITLTEWKRGMTVVKADGTNVTDLTTPTDYKDYFALTNADWETKLSSDKKNLLLDSPIYVKKGGSASATGIKSDPRDTIANAIKLCNDKDCDYTIKINGEITGAQEIPATLTKTTSGTYKAKSILISGATGNTTDILNGGFTQTSNGTTLKILSDVPVTIKNLKITGGYASSSSVGGGGLYAKGDVTLSDGTVVSGNITASCGGGIYNDSKTLTIESGAEISGNQEKGVTDCGGGGIFNYEGTVIIKGGVIKSNSADHEGGAIYSEGGTCYIYGDTLIGKEVSVAPSEWYNGSNKAENGGAICLNGGNIYLGYKNNNGTAQNDNDANVRIMGNTVKSSSSKGGAIFVKDGTLQVAKTSIAYNYTPKDGGGIFTKATVQLLEDAVIKGNNAYSYGGGAYVDAGGSLSMKSNATIGGIGANDGNSAQSGGGIYITSTSAATGTSSVTIGVSSSSTSNPQIVGNKATGEGGGIAISNFNSTVTLLSGSIENNKVTGGTTGGGGVSVQGGTFNVYGGTISGNYIENPSLDGIKGGAIDMNTSGKLHLKGTIDIPYGGEPRKNDVNLRSNPIYLDGAISLPSGKTSVATVIPRTYERGEEIVELSTTPAATISNISPYREYFAIAHEAWELSASSNNKKLVLDSPIYVAGTGYLKCSKLGDDSNANGTKAAPFATIAKACELFDDTDAEYTICIDGTITGAQTIPDTLKTTSDGTYKAKTLTIRGVNGLGTDNKTPKDVLDGNADGVTLTVNTSVPVTIKTLKITNAFAGDQAHEYVKGGGMNIAGDATVVLGDSSSTWGNYESNVLITGNTGCDGSGIYSAGSLTLYNCTVSDNISYDASSTNSFIGALYIKGSGANLTLTGGNLHFGNNFHKERNNTIGSITKDIQLGSKSFNGSTGYSTVCQIIIHETLSSGFSAVLDAGMQYAFGYSRANRKEVLTGDGVASSYNRFVLFDDGDASNTYSIDSTGKVVQTAK